MTAKNVKQFARPVRDWHIESTNEPGILGDDGIRNPDQHERRFEIVFHRPESLASIEVTGPVTSVHLYNGQASVQFKNMTPKLDPSDVWTEVHVFFDSNTAGRILRIKLTHTPTTVHMGPLQDCLGDIEEDMELRCADGTVMINSTLAWATCEAIRGAKSFGGSKPAFDLSPYDTQTVAAAKRILISRTVTTAEISPRVIELMYHLLAKGRENVWPLVRNQLTLHNVMAYLRLADELQDTDTRQQAEAMVRKHIAKFQIRDVAAFCDAIELPTSWSRR